MVEMDAATLESLGREAVEQVAGPDVVEAVAVAAGEDVSDRPTYQFAFLIDQGRARQRAGLLRIRLMQALRDRLIEQGDAHYPVIQILDRADWEKRRGA